MVYTYIVMFIQGTEVAVKECFSSIKQYGFDFEKVFNREVSILK